MTEAETAWLLEAAERTADNLLVLAFVTGQFDVGTPFGVRLRDAVRDRACYALGIDPPTAEELAAQFARVGDQQEE